MQPSNQLKGLVEAYSHVGSEETAELRILEKTIVNTIGVYMVSEGYTEKDVVEFLKTSSDGVIFEKFAYAFRSGTSFQYINENFEYDTNHRYVEGAIYERLDEGVRSFIAKVSRRAKPFLKKLQQATGFGLGPGKGGKRKLVTTGAGTAAALDDKEEKAIRNTVRSGVGGVGQKVVDWSKQKESFTPAEEILAEGISDWWNKTWNIAKQGFKFAKQGYDATFPSKEKKQGINQALQNRAKGLNKLGFGGKTSMDDASGDPVRPTGGSGGASGGSSGRGAKGSTQGSTGGSRGSSGGSSGGVGSPGYGRGGRGGSSGSTGSTGGSRGSSGSTGSTGSTGGSSGSTRDTAPTTPPKGRVADVKPQTPKRPPADHKDGMKKWAQLYGPGGDKELKSPTKAQRAIFKQYGMGEEVEVDESLQDTLDKLTKKGQRGLERMGFKINREKRGTARPAPGSKPGQEGGGKYTREMNEVELVTSFLVSEGFSDTTEGALVMLEGMSESWFNDILDVRLMEEAMLEYLQVMGEAESRDEALYIVSEMDEEAIDILAEQVEEIMESMASANRMKELEKERLSNRAPSVKYPAKPAPYGGARSREFEKRLPKPQSQKARSREFEHGSTRSPNTPSGNLGDGLPRDKKGNIMR